MNTKNISKARDRYWYVIYIYGSPFRPHSLSRALKTSEVEKAFNNITLGVLKQNHIDFFETQSIITNSANYLGKIFVIEQMNLEEDYDE